MLTFKVSEETYIGILNFMWGVWSIPITAHNPRFLLVNRIREKLAEENDD